MRDKSKGFELKYVLEGKEIKVERKLVGRFKVSDHLRMAKALNKDVMMILDNLSDTVEEHERVVANNEASKIIRLK